jgi:hypothetical protein
MTIDQLQRLSNCLKDYQEELEDLSFRAANTAQDISYLLNELAEELDSDEGIECMIDEACE